MTNGGLSLRWILALALVNLIQLQAAAQTEIKLHNFGGKNNNGFIVNSGLVFDTAGTLYGTTSENHGPSDISGYGTVFELTPMTGGGWIEKVIHSFSKNGTDGYYPYAGVITDAAGNLATSMAPPKTAAHTVAAPSSR